MAISNDIYAQLPLGFLQVSFQNPPRIDFCWLVMQRNSKYFQLLHFKMIWPLWCSRWWWTLFVAIKNTFCAVIIVVADDDERRLFAINVLWHVQPTLCHRALETSVFHKNLSSSIDWMHTGSGRSMQLTWMGHFCWLTH